MRRLFTASVSAAVLVAFATGVRAADPTPKEIVAKAIKAHGGEEFLSKMMAAQSRAKGKLILPGLGEVEFTSETAYVIPDKFKNVLEFEVMKQKLKVTAIMNKDKISVVTTVGDKEVDSGDAVKEAFKDVPHILKVSQLTTLKDKAFTFDTFGEAKVEGKAAIGVRVSAKGQKDITLFFDKETGLTVKMEYRTADPTTGAEVNEERIVTEYEKNKDGIPVPKKVIVKHDGKVFMEAEMLEMTYLEKLDDAEFKK